MRWNKLEKLQAERGVTTWVKLKHLLVKELKVKVNSADIHKLLMTRKKEVC